MERQCLKYFSNLFMEEEGSINKQSRNLGERVSEEHYIDLISIPSFDEVKGVVLGLNLDK